MTMKRAALVAALLAMVFGVSTANAADATPEGTWKSSTGESHYEFSFCGDGTQLCAKLVYLRDDALNAETQPYLGTYLVQNAMASAKNQWKGDVHVLGQTAGGTFTLTGAKTMTLEGCYLVFCKKYDLIKIK